MSKGRKRAIVKRQLRKPPAVVYGEGEEEPIDFNSLREDYKAKRRAFVREYIKDFNATQAILRLGYPYARQTAQTKGSQFLNEPYTQHILAEMMESLDEKAIVTRTEVLLGLKREANAPDVAFSSNASTRIAAWRTLTKVLGMEVVKAEVNMTLGGGVMTIPLSGSPDDWEKAAAAAQAKLKEQVRK